MSELPDWSEYRSPVIDRMLQGFRDQGRGGGRGLPPDAIEPTLPGMDPWQQTVETRLGQIHTDMRDLGKKVDAHLLWMIGGFAAVLGGLATGFLWLADKLP